MTSQNDRDGAFERPVFQNEETADVEGHIRKAHTGPADFRISGPEGAAHSDAEEDGPDVEGHIRPTHTDPSIRIAGPEGAAHSDADEDGPDVEGHVARF